MDHGHVRLVPPLLQRGQAQLTQPLTVFVTFQPGHQQLSVAFSPGRPCHPLSMGTRPVWRTPDGVSHIACTISCTYLELEIIRGGKQNCQKDGPFLALSIQNRSNFGRKFVRPLHFLFGHFFYLCGRTIGRLPTLFKYRVLLS